MSIDEHQVPYDEFITNEVNSLSVIESLSSIGSNFQDLATKAQVFYYKYKSKKNHKNTRFVFECSLDLIIEDREMPVFFEAILEPNYSEVSYSIVLYEKGEPSVAIRKFHFDYALPVTGQKSKPLYHLQYGGKPTPNMSCKKIDDSMIQNWLSSPRIPFFPINLALLLDMIFCEFSSEKTVKITESQEWRNLVKKNEKFILEKYFKNISHYFNADHKSSFLFREFCYGKT